MSNRKKIKRRPSKPVTGLDAAIADHEQRLADISRARATALPGPLLGAFAPKPIELCGFKLRPIQMVDEILLARIDSVMLRCVKFMVEHQNLDGMKLARLMEKTLSVPPKGVSQMAHDAEMNTSFLESFYLFCIESDRALELLDRGRAVYRRAALLALKDVPASAMGDIQRGLGMLFAQKISTVVVYEADHPAGDGSFQSPPVQKGTGSAGGLTCWER